MYSINRKDALSLLSRLDFDVLPENEQNALLDLERLFQERKEPIETCLADLNGFEMSWNCSGTPARMILPASPKKSSI